MVQKSLSFNNKNIWQALSQHKNKSSLASVPWICLKFFQLPRRFISFFFFPDLISSLRSPSSILLVRFPTRIQSAEEKIVINPTTYYYKQTDWQTDRQGLWGTHDALWLLDPRTCGSLSHTWRHRSESIVGCRSCPFVLFFPHLSIHPSIKRLTDLLNFITATLVWRARL